MLSTFGLLDGFGVVEPAGVGFQNLHLDAGSIRVREFREHRGFVLSTSANKPSADRKPNLQVEMLHRFVVLCSLVDPDPSDESESAVCP